MTSEIQGQVECASKCHLGVCLLMRVQKLRLQRQARDPFVHISGLGQCLALQPSGHQSEFPAAVDCRSDVLRAYSIISHLCYAVRACIVHCCTCHLPELSARGRNAPGPGFPSSAPRFPHQCGAGRSLLAVDELRRPHTIGIRPEVIQLSLLLTLPIFLFCCHRRYSAIFALFLALILLRFPDSSRCDRVLVQIGTLWYTNCSEACATRPMLRSTSRLAKGATSGPSTTAPQAPASSFSTQLATQ